MANVDPLLGGEICLAQLTGINSMTMLIIDVAVVGLAAGDYFRQLKSIEGELLGMPDVINSNWLNK